MENIFNVVFDPRDLDMNELKEALRQIDEARAIVVQEMNDWRKERAKELTNELNSLFQQIGEEGYCLYLGDVEYTATELLNEYCSGEVVTKLV